MRLIIFFAAGRERQEGKNGSWPVSRVLSRTVIPLRQPSLTACSNLPEPSAGRTNGFLFGLAPSGVYHATNCYQSRGALLPHPRSEEHTSELQSRPHLVCRLLLEK